MKHPPIRKTTAPTPRYTLWVPSLLAAGLSLLWLAVLANLQR